MKNIIKFVVFRSIENNYGGLWFKLAQGARLERE
jgi:hypothetical protein